LNYFISSEHMIHCTRTNSYCPYITSLTNQTFASVLVMLWSCGI